MSFLLPKSGGVYRALRSWAINKSGYRKYGLRLDDLIMEEYPGVAVALKRLSAQELYDREFRLKVAIDLSARHQLLPKNLWTTDETDIPYLTPVLQVVEKEMAEREEWDAKNK